MPRPAPAAQATVPPPTQDAARAATAANGRATAVAPLPPAAQPAAKAAAKAPPPAKAAAPVKQTPPAPAAPAGPVQIRLGSLRSPDAARDEWAKLKRENPDLLGKLTAVAVRTDLGDKSLYYRIQAGSVGEAAAAGTLCAESERRSL